MSDTEHLYAMIADACFGKDAPAAYTRNLGEYLAGHGVDAEDAEALIAEPPRLGLYRMLIRQNAVNVIASILDRSQARFEHHAPSVWDASVDAFLAEVGPRTPHLRDVPSEFFAWACPTWRANDTLPPFLVDHAELELAEFTVGIGARRMATPALVEVSADRSLVFEEPHRILRLAWAVHEMPIEADAPVPEKRDVLLFLYRDAEHATCTMELTPLAAAILGRLLVGEPLGRAIAAACAAQNRALDDDVLAGAAQLLGDLGERGVLLGASG